MLHYYGSLRTGAAAIALLLVLGQTCRGTEPAGTSATADFFVAPGGNDAWSGKLAQPNADRSDGPLATLQGARDAVRRLIAGEKRSVKVLLRQGTYRLTETVVFSLEDSAGEGHTITYAAYPGEKPVLSSAAPITGWRRPDKSPAQLPEAARGKVWVADASALDKFHTLYDGDRELPRARGKGFSPTNSTPRGTQDYQTVQFPPGAVKRYANLKDVELVIVPCHFWIMNVLPIESIDEATCTLKTAVPATYPPGKNGMTDRDNAWIENALEVLDEPGEWVLDTSQGLVYLWPDGDRPGDGVVAPTLTELVRVEGRIDYEGPVDTPVKGLVFQGLTFTQGDRFGWHGRTGWGLQHDWECFDKPTALVRLRGAEGCAIEDCEFANSGHTAVRLDLHCQENRIAGNHIHHVGGSTTSGSTTGAPAPSSPGRAARTASPTTTSTTSPTPRSSPPAASAARRPGPVSARERSAGTRRRKSSPGGRGPSASPISTHARTSSSTTRFTTRWRPSATATASTSPAPAAATRCD